MLGSASGVKWVSGGPVGRLTQGKVQAISDELREAYQRTQAEPRYAYALGGKHVVVTPSATLEAELVKHIHHVEE